MIPRGLAISYNDSHRITEAKSFDMVCYLRERRLVYGRSKHNSEDKSGREPLRRFRAAHFRSKRNTVI